MSVFSDRRRLRQIGGMGAYFHQVAWSVWWRWSRTWAMPRRAEVPASSGVSVLERDERRRTRPAA